MDVEFEKNKDKLPLVGVNRTTARERVPDIEHQRQLIKEGIRSATSDFPFYLIPMMILIQTVYTIVMLLNTVRPLSYVIRGLSPGELVTTC